MPAGSCHSVEAPGGTRRWFRVSDRRLVQIDDPFGQWARLSYPPAGGWTVADSLGREHTVSDAAHPSQPPLRQVESVTLATFDGGTATYDLVYQSPQCELIKPNTINGPFVEPYSCLERVDLPDGSSFGFSYNSRGNLTVAELPTRGRLEYSYTLWTLDRDQPPGAEPAWFVRVQGVATKSIVDWDGTPLGTFQYGSTVELDGGPRRVRVTDPAGNLTVHYFNRGLAPEYTNGLPLDLGTADASDPELFLSRREYQGATESAQSLRRSVYLAYTAGPGFADNGQLAHNRMVKEKVIFHDDRDPALAARVSYRLTEYSSFDGLGHFRRTEESDDTGAGSSRTRVVSDNKSSAVFDCEPFLDAHAVPTCPTPAPAPPAASSIWVLGSYDNTLVTEGASSLRMAYCFDPRGFLLRRRAQVDVGSVAANDLLVAFTEFGTTGFPGTETYHGGDVRNDLPITDTCASGLPGSFDYQIAHSYSNGSLATSRYTGVGFLSVDRTIDRNTGLVASSRDSSGVETSYEYDALGRPTAVDPAAAHGACVRYGYTPASDTARARTTVTRLANESTGCSDTVLQTQEVLFDALGRVAIDATTLPGGSKSARRTIYDGLGTVTRVSELEAAPADLDSFNPLHWTTFGNLDRYGRAGTITQPDGFATTKVYHGAQWELTTQRVMSVDTAGASRQLRDATTIARYDRGGRLVEIRQALDPGDTAQTETRTTYQYDAADRLRLVDFAGERGGAQRTQTRTFTYDGRGFLTAEVHPVVAYTYPRYDARGHALVRTGGTVPLRFAFDSAERLERVEHRDDSNTVYKRFTYYGAGAEGLNAGKLATTTRWNTTPWGVYEVGETWEHNGRMGRPSARRTVVRTPEGRELRLTQSGGNDHLGGRARTSYPCQASAAEPSTCLDTARIVYQTYDQGLVRKIGPKSNGSGAWLELLYHDNAMLRRVEHPEVSRTYFQDRHPQRMRRPGSIGIIVPNPNGPGTVTANFPDAYDGAGNVIGIGAAETYSYDLASRVRSHDANRRYRYDDFGNLIAIERLGQNNQWAVEDLTTSTATNRLTLAGTRYDSAGTLEARPGASYTWDSFNLISSVTSANNSRWPVYTAEDERVLVIEPDGRGGYRERIRLRGFDNQVLREYVSACSRRLGTSSYLFADGFEAGSAGCWTTTEGLSSGQPAGSALVWVEDTVYRPGGVGLSFHADGTKRHHFLDHLAAPRLVVSAAGTQQDYYFSPFGEQRTPVPESVDSGADPFRPTLRYAGHVRDINSVGEAADDLDAMHARYCSPLYGRFLSIDPRLRRSSSLTPQRWNLYSYAMSNPLKYVDPDGEDLKIVYDFAQSGLSTRQQLDVVAGVRDRFTRAGVNSVQAYFRGSGSSARADKPSDAVVHVRLQKGTIHGSAFGVTPQVPGNKSTVSVGAGPKDEGALTKFLINVTAHEIGHATGALPRYAGDSTKPGAVLNPLENQPDPGTIMQTNVPADAQDLSKRLNDPQNP